MAVCVSGSRRSTASTASSSASSVRISIISISIISISTSVSIGMSMSMSISISISTSISIRIRVHQTVKFASTPYSLYALPCPSPSSKSKCMSMSMSMSMSRIPSLHDMHSRVVVVVNVVISGCFTYGVGDLRSNFNFISTQPPIPLNPSSNPTQPNSANSQPSGLIPLLIDVPPAIINTNTNTNYTNHRIYLGLIQTTVVPDWKPDIEVNSWQPFNSVRQDSKGDGFLPTRAVRNNRTLLAKRAYGYSLFAAFFRLILWVSGSSFMLETCFDHWTMAEQ
ncbi:hypothetical protein MBM_04583 [Drepanopeziza brunnea f. sp. 'multigermtubi' MB_m1]|uniref:Uncharacterized protein n=1 Tax=Marssonina brunnea f. sp. multigermtubi (strain MB_m1) TaxID=1072389 RepID=K1WVD9_MARBU|nr:uncharacterized protein MBM_04583 [Drepanopeziza brunnea f. sp. 'multigermtubi' MB_m1]EKD17006.1 hypothetical protein MBM_04583 [Drepanopeziza brunnea f. sp. 'multigermtubi' MB_m1]